MATKRILIVEDDVILSEELAESLQYEGYETARCSDSTKAETLISSGDYDIILLDYKMPEVTGVEILKKLKAGNIRKHIFILSGRPSVAQLIRDENLSDMVKRIIKKPIDFPGFLEEIKNL